MEEKKFYESFYENGKLKERCPLNKKGELHGWKIVFDELGNEIEKIKYINDMRIGNPFSAKTSEEMVGMLGGTIEDDPFDEEGEGEIIITDKTASTLLLGEKYYKEQENGLQELMKDLGVSNYQELLEYMKSEEHKEEHKEEQIVKDFKEFFNYYEEKEVIENEK